MPHFQMFGFILIVLGGYLLFNLHWFGFISLLVGLVLSFANGGIQVDFATRSYREYYGVLKYKFGEWHEMPTIEYVTVFIEQYGQNTSMVSIQRSYKFSKVKVSLIASRTQRYDGGYFNTKEEAMKAGLTLAKGLNIELLDYTEREPKWIDY